MRRVRQAVRNITYETQNCIIILSLLVLAGALVFRPIPVDQVREVYLLVGMIVGGLLAHLNHATSESQSNVHADRVEAVNVATPAGDGTRELNPDDVEK